MKLKLTKDRQKQKLIKMNGNGSVCSLLVIVLDANPVWWGKNLTTRTTQLTLSKCLDAVMVFANSHLVMSHHNKLGLIASHSNASHFVYPKRCPAEGTDAGPAGRSAGNNDGKYELFDHMNSQIKEEIKDLIVNSMHSELENDCLITGSLAMALCYIHRMEKSTPVGVQISARVLVIKGSEDNPSQYMNFMNSVFTAQKQNVIIDACILDNESGLLQQACDITGGVYLRIPQPAGILQYLLWLFLPDPATREKLTVPPKVQVDYRAACFCHRHLVDIGYVCSVCLSIFCTFSPICSTCQTTFKIMAPPKMLKKKVKKTAS